MKCQSLFSGKNKKYMVSLSSAEFAQAGLSGSVGCRLVIWRLQVRPPPGQQHSFMEIDHEIFSMVIPFR